MAVEELEGRGHLPGAGQRCDGLAGPDEGVEEPDDGVLRGAGRAQPHGDLGDQPEGALGADQQRHEVVPGDALGRLAADPDELAGAGDDLEGEDVVAGDPVLHAAHPAGVGRDVAADRRPRGARGVRRVPEAVLGAGGPQVVVDDPRLDHGEALHGVDPQHGRHPLEADDDPTGDGVGAPGQAGARPARDDRHAVEDAPPDDGAHLVGIRRAGDRQGQGPRRPLGLVVAVALHRGGLGEQRPGGEPVGEGADVGDGHLGGRGAGHRGEGCERHRTALMGRTATAPSMTNTMPATNSTG